MNKTQSLNEQYLKGVWSDGRLGSTPEQIRLISLSELIKMDETFESVLEFGCGDGVLIPYIRSHFHEKTRYIGVDVSDAAIDLFTRRLMGVDPELSSCIHGIVADSEDYIKTVTEKFSTIILSDVLNYLNNPCIFLRSLKEILRGNGYIIVSIFIGNNENDLKPNIARMIEDIFNDSVISTFRVMRHYRIQNILDQKMWEQWVWKL